MSAKLNLGPDGKDVVIFATKEDHSTPSTVELPEIEPPPGLILSNGEINWNCPCLGGMATGPCGVQFREAFSCFHYSEADPKGSDCYEAFSKMQECMADFPAVYNKVTGDDDDDGLNFDNLEDKANEESETSSHHAPKTDAVAAESDK